MNVDIHVKTELRLKVQGEAGERVGQGLGKLIRANAML